MHATAATAHAHHDEPSRWPLVVGVGMALLALGLAFHWVGILGAIVLLGGIWGWAAQDTGYFRKDFDFAPFTPGKFHPDTIGMMLFLCTEVMFFGGMFAYYFYSRANVPGYIPGDVHLPVLATGINTAILVASSFTMHWADMSIRKNNRRNFIIGLVLTVALGAVFLAFQAKEYMDFYAEGFVFTSSQFSSNFYMLTGVHGLHVFGGLLFILVVLIRALKGQFDAKRHVAVQTSSMYWHFVDVVWIFLYATLYLRLW